MTAKHDGLIQRLDAEIADIRAEVDRLLKRFVVLEDAKAALQQSAEQPKSAPKPKPQPESTAVPRQWAVDLKSPAPPAIPKPVAAPKPRVAAKGSTVDQIEEFLRANGPSSVKTIAEGIGIEYQTIYNALIGRFFEKFHKVNTPDGKVWGLRVSAEKQEAV
jgi:hypothetical protein